jgi:N-acetylneuraminate synthase
LAFGYINKESKPNAKAFLEAYQSVEGREALLRKVKLLHCVSEYPAPHSETNLKCIETLFQSFGLPTGFSDHSVGTAVSIAAVALGAQVIEKHFTIDQKMQGPDHSASLSPEELKSLVEGIRQVEVALGSIQKRVSPSEWKNRKSMRKSLVTLKAIKKGEIFSEANLGMKRPAHGIEPGKYWEWLDQVASRDYGADETLEH